MFVSSRHTRINVLSLNPQRGRQVYAIRSQSAANANRDSSALQAKLDEVIRTSAARNSFVGIENLTPEEIESIRKSVEALARKRSETHNG
jgi:low affinity Fe/Cu permease